MRHVSRTHRVALDWLFDRINLDTKKSKSGTLTPKKPTRRHTDQGKFTRDEWNHLLNLFYSSHFSSTKCSEVMSKRLSTKMQVKKESPQNRSR